MQPDGVVYTWGSGHSGELGVPTDRESVVPFPTPVAACGKCVQVCCGDLFTIALRTDGSVVSFGSNAKGRLGRSTASEISPPGLVEGISGATHIAAGNAHALAVCGSDGTVWGWGNGRKCSLSAVNEGADVISPKPILLADGTPLRGVTKVFAGFQNSAALTASGQLFVWGDNNNDKCGIAKLPVVRHPTLLDAGQGAVHTVSLGSMYSACVTVDGALYTWGFGMAGNLGHGDRKNRAVPTRVDALNGIAIVDVSCTSGQINPVATGDVRSKESCHTLAIGRDGVAYSWGTCHKGMLGNHGKKFLCNVDGDELVPYRIGGPLRDAPCNGIAIGAPSRYLEDCHAVGCSSSSIHSAIATSAGDVFTFGCGSGGRMGIRRYMEGLHNARSRNKCYVSQPTAIEVFREQHLCAYGLSTSRHHMACLVRPAAADSPPRKAAVEAPCQDGHHDQGVGGSDDDDDADHLERNTSEP